MALYVGIVRKPPTTMMDLEMATAPSKSVVTALRPSTATPTSQHQLQTKSEPNLGWQPIQQSHQKPGTQLYAAPYDDDPMPAYNHHHEPPSQTTPVKRPTSQPQNRRLDNSNNRSTINDKGGTTSLHPPWQPILRPTNDRCSGTSPTLPTDWITVPSPTTPPLAGIYRPPTPPPLCESSDQPTEPDTIVATIFDQLNQLKALFCVHFRPSNTNPTPESTTHQNINFSTHHVAQPAIREIEPASLLPTSWKAVSPPPPSCNHTQFMTGQTRITTSFPATLH